MKRVADSQNELARLLGEALRARGLRISAAESCTGGLLAGAITAIAGSSAWFEQSVVTYSNAAKTRWVGVPTEVLEVHGAVSEATVTAMAHGVIEHLASDVGVAISGIAGPDGAVPDKPVGSVWIAVSIRGGGTTARLHRFEGDRSQVRRAAVESALHATLARLVASDQEAHAR